ncbi:MAG: hypothetical protein WKF59_23905 [Chitinophagaceae bacterium]
MVSNLKEVDAIAFLLFRPEAKSKVIPPIVETPPTTARAPIDFKSVLPLLIIINVVTPLQAG